MRAKMKSLIKLPGFWFTFMHTMHKGTCMSPLLKVIKFEKSDTFYYENKRFDILIYNKY